MFVISVVTLMSLGSPWGMKGAVSYIAESIARGEPNDLNKVVINATSVCHDVYDSLVPHVLFAAKELWANGYELRRKEQ